MGIGVKPDYGHRIARYLEHPEATLRSQHSVTADGSDKSCIVMMN